MQVDSWAPYFHYRNGKQLVANQKLSLISLTDIFSVQLQLSACLPHQFTCHNGKCVSMNSRCDNVEVITLFKVFVPSFDRIVTIAAMRRSAGWFRSTKKNIWKTNHLHLHKAWTSFPLQQGAGLCWCQISNKLVGLWVWLVCRACWVFRSRGFGGAVGVWE